MGVRTDTRARMIASAALLLREHCVAATSIPKVLAHSDGPRGSVAHHFPGGRTELMAEAITWAGNLVTDALTKARVKGSSAASTFAFLCDFYSTQLTSTDYTAGCPVGAAAQEAFDDPALGPVTAGVIGSWVAALAQTLIEEGQTTAEAEDLALLCVSSLEGAVLVARVQRSTKPVETVKARLLPLLSN